MACFIGMKRSFLQGLLWLYLYGFGFMALSLEPGFLDFDNLPDTNFSCVGKVIGGYYADLETNCQMFHVCTIGQLEEPMDIRFLCLNGTVFDQETRVCERIDEVDCTKSEQFYSLNLELYGHSQSSNLEEIPETEQPLIIKSTPTTTTTTTTPPPPPRKTTRAPYYTSLAPPTATTPRTNHHHISTHHFPILNPSASDIRFNPEEINISLHPGAPPDIRTNKGPISYYSDKKVTNSNTNSDKHLGVTTHSEVYTHEGIENSGTSTQKLHRYNSGTPSDLSGYDFTYRHEDSGEYTEPPESYRIRTEYKPSQEYAELRNPPQRFKSSTYRSDYSPSTHNNNNYQQKSSTTIRNYFVHSLKPPAPNQQSHYGEIRTEKSPQRLQLPLPLLPALPVLTFSSPAPFSLKQRIEQKRYTKDHIPPPRIVISASASVSDASGKKLNYSLGTIRSAQLSKPPPSTYDEYKDEDVALDPFYLDVPKVKGTRKKRSATEDTKRQEERKINYSEIIRNDEEALNVLKFLFDWYKHDKTNPARFTTPLPTPLDNEGISSINHGLAPEADSSNIAETEDDSLNFKFDSNDSFKKTDKNSTVGEDGVSVSHNIERINNVEEKYTITHVPDNEKDGEIFQHEEDYVNDNYEPLTYREPERKYKDEVEENEGKEKLWSNKEENKKYSIPDYYIDENIEPIFYKERSYEKSNRNDIIPNKVNYQKSQLKTKDYDNESNDYKSKEMRTQTEMSIAKSSSNFENIYNINDHIHNKSVTTEHSAYEANNRYSSQIENKEVKLTTEQPEEQTSTNQLSHEQYTTLPTYEIQNTLTTEKIIHASIKARNNRRGNRKFTDIINKTEKEADFNPAVVDKLLEKPHRAKDDYDFLRTIHIHIPTPKTSYQNMETEKLPSTTETEILPSTTEIEFIPTITESPIITTSSVQPLTLKTIVEVVTTIKEDDETPDILSYTLTTAPVTTTEKPRPKTRRGKFRFKDFSSEEPIYIRKKPQSNFNETTNGYNENAKNNSSQSPENQDRQSKVDIIVNDSQGHNFNQSREHQEQQTKIDFIANESQENNSNKSINHQEQQSKIHIIVNDSQEPYSEILESTTNADKRGRNEDVNSSVAPTTILLTSESSVTSLHFNKDNRNTVSLKTTTDSVPVQDSYIEIYATSFVPTTETIHITKKKQLKDNLLDVKFDTTTENIAETTEEIPETTTWSTNELKKLIHKIESNTNSVVAPTKHEKHKKLTTEAITESDYTTETIIHTTTIPSSIENKSNTFNMSGMNLVSVSVEEKDKHLTLDLDNTTEDMPITTDGLELNESIGFPSLDFRKEMNDFITKLDSIKFEHKNKFKEKNVNSIEEDTSNDMKYTSESTDGTTLNLETTTNIYKNTQIPTTFEQTTIQPTTIEVISIDTTQPTTIEETTTMRSRRKGGKPTRRRTISYEKPGYRHRFSTDSFTRRPQPRKQTIEEEIVDIYRRGKDLTTENYRDSVGKKEYVLTDFPLRKSVNPTQAEKTLVTTPFSQRPAHKRQFFFNCFGKEIDKFYPDLRDCRLFHYCTQGYSKNQLLDMKFVCDFSTFFDDEKLICTKTKPKRCL